MKTAYLLLAICLLWAAQATVFEAESSEDVDLFVQDYDTETIGLLFYDGSEDNSDDEDWFGRLSSKVLGIFMSNDQYGRNTEDWVEMFDDKLHLMRVDTTNPDNLRAVESFFIDFVPFIIIMDNQRTVLREQMNEDTYDHVRDILDKRPNMLHKTGGAALKSFNLEPDTDTPQTEPQVIQYFDLEEGAPVNVEEPLQRQYVNWSPTDVIGPDGTWEERGRDWVTNYEIPESGIKNQQNTGRVSAVPKTRDDPRSNTHGAPTERTTSRPSRPAQGVPSQAATTLRPAKPAGQQTARPTQQTARPTQQTARPTGQQTARPAQATSRPAQGSAQPTQGARPTQATQGAQPTAAASTRASAKPAATQQQGYQRHPYHASGYQGKGEFNDQYYNRQPYGRYGRY